MDLDNKKPSPSWNEIFQNIGMQLHSRSGLLTKRVLIASSLGLVAIFLINFLGQLMRIGLLFSKSFDESDAMAFFYGVVTVVVVLIVTIILMALVKIEQVVWLDSYFDGINLSPKESRKIARRLYWGWSYLQFKLFYRYYLWVVLAAMFLLSSWFYIFAISGFSSSSITTLFSPIIFIGGLVGLVLWQRYMKIKLSYAPFLFLDRFKGGLVQSSDFWKDFFRELKTLNNISKDETFKKNIMFEIGGDVAMQLVEYIAGQIQRGFMLASQALPPVAGAVVSSLGTTAARGAAEVGHRIVIFAKLSARYVLYSYAFQAVHGRKSEINEYIYSLKN